VDEDICSGSWTIGSAESSSWPYGRRLFRLVLFCRDVNKEQQARYGETCRSKRHSTTHVVTGKGVAVTDADGLMGILGAGSTNIEWYY